MTIEELLKRAGCPVCGNMEVEHDPERHEQKTVGGLNPTPTIEIECTKCHAVGHVTWNEPRNKPLYCCWPEPTEKTIKP